MRKWIYGVGSPQGNEAIYVKRFERHNAEVVTHFRDRANDLLVMDLTKGDGWEKLCGFLGADVPDRAFPHANKAQERQTATAPGAQWLRWAKSLRSRVAKRLG